MDDLVKSRKLLWSLAVVFVLLWLYLLGVRTLVPPDEGRYAEMAREMWASGDWITTRLNGIKYFEKPPLQTWMTALAFSAFGLGEWQARLWSGLSGLLGIAITAYAGLRLFGARVGLYAALVLGSTLFWVAASQIASLDMGLSGMTTLALGALLLAQRDDATPAQRRHWMLACWAGMALAVLTKGLIGVVLPGAVLVLYTVAARHWSIWTRLHLGKGLLLFFAITTPWFVLVALRNPEQPYFFFIHEHFQRFLTDDHHRRGPWHYFIGPLVAGLLPWLALAPASLAGALKRDAGAVFQPRLLLLIWAVFIFFFFSYSSSKLPGYIVPIFPAVALLLACQLERSGARLNMAAAGLVALVGLVIVVLVPLVPGMVGRPGEVELIHAYQPWVLAAGALGLAGGTAALLLARRGRRDLMVLVMALAGFAATELILAGFEPYGYHRSARALVPQIEAALRPGSKIYSVGTYEQSLPFYLQRTVVLVDYLDEFAFGLQQQPQLAIPTVDAFVAEWTRDAAAGVRHVALVRDDIYADLQRRGVPMRLVAQDTRRIIIANSTVAPATGTAPATPPATLQKEPPAP